MDFSGQTALVTGASKGIGRAIAQSLHAGGANVVVSSRKQDALDDVVDSLGGDDRLFAFAANAGEPDDAAACVNATIERYGALDILVNNAATNPYNGSLADLDLPRAEKTARVNQYGVVLWSQLAWHRSMKTRGGTIINIASIGGLSIDRNIGYYNATKAAVIHLTRQLAVEMGPLVRVNAVAPGLVKTDMARAIWEEREAEFSERFPLARLGEPIDIANAVRFLASDDASWITGHTMVVDGGALAAPMMP